MRPACRTSIFWNWFALFSRKRVPKDVIAKLNAAVVNGLAEPAVREQIGVQGMEIPPREELTPKALSALQIADIEKWLMRALASLRLLIENDSLGFATCELGEVFRSDHPQSLRDRVLCTEAPEHYEATTAMIAFLGPRLASRR
jgi:hypothetical protein